MSSAWGLRSHPAIAHFLSTDTTDCCAGDRQRALDDTVKERTVREWSVWLLCGWICGIHYSLPWGSTELAFNRAMHACTHKHTQSDASFFLYSKSLYLFSHNVISLALTLTHAYTHTNKTGLHAWLVMLSDSGCGCVCVSGRQSGTRGRTVA